MGHATGDRSARRADGTYRLQVVLPPGYQCSPQDMGPSDFTDSDVDSAGYTGLLRVLGITVFDIDAGLKLS